MRVIPVLDVRSGRAVHAVAGDRAHYGPLRSVLHAGSDPVDLARAARDVLGLGELYLADLDAIVDGSAPALPLLRALAGLGLTTWVDAGVRDAADVPRLIGAGVARVVVGLETVRGPSALAGIVAAAGADRVAFSLDLVDGRPLVDTRGEWGTDDPGALADLAVDAGVRALIRLDLARVGTGRGVGPALDRDRPGVDRIVGGGVAGPADLAALARLGYAAVLVGSALHDGRIGAGDVAARASSPG